MTQFIFYFLFPLPPSSSSSSCSSSSFPLQQRRRHPRKRWGERLAILVLIIRVPDSLPSLSLTATFHPPPSTHGPRPSTLPTRHPSS
ncbi:hypothetical protein E2C01_072247 [Portunus trituberculatus]|uniref:Uncharacterized protein n=1 Tax=Portunus trituberculatus TaxID=210409 RepID=A0A5B7HXH2_PORTR|nr:hypothetical protein [Portunus trituberculatus]